MKAWIKSKLAIMRLIDSIALSDPVEVSLPVNIGLVSGNIPENGCVIEIVDVITADSCKVHGEHRVIPGLENLAAFALACCINVKLIHQP